MFGRYWHCVHRFSPPHNRQNICDRQDCSAPPQRDGDIARHAVRKTDDLGAQRISALAEMPLPKIIDLLRDASQRFLPTGLLLINRSPAIRAQLVGEAVDLYLGQTVAYRALD